MRSWFSVPFLLVACTGGGEQPRQVLPVATEPNLLLHVSNQSFDIDPVYIQVHLDDELALEGDFLVEGQHSWHTFEFELTPGHHTLRAVTDAGRTDGIDTIEVTDSARHGVLNFWYYPAGSSEPYGPAFSFVLLDDPPLFE